MGAVAARPRRGATDDLELDALADRFQLNGGAIHNIGPGRRAPRRRDASRARITTAHVVRATQRELQKTGRPSDAAAFGPLAELRHGNGVHR